MYERVFFYSGYSCTQSGQMTVKAWSSFSAMAPAKTKTKNKKRKVKNTETICEKMMRQRIIRDRELLKQNSLHLVGKMLRAHFSALILLGV